MLFRQCNETFIRSIGPHGYLTNQRTRRDRLFDDSGRVFLSEISRSPTRVEDAVQNLCGVYADVTPELIRPDFIDFLNYLERYGFVVTGSDTAELDGKDLGFRYDAGDLKPFTFDFRQDDELLDVDESQRFLDPYLRDHPMVWEFHMEVTSRCNERCIHCYIPHTNKTTDIDFSLATKTIDQLHDMGTLSITFGGGEATLHPKLPQMIRYAREADLSVSLLSNLMNVSDDLFDALRESRMSLVQVSVYSMDAKEHDTITKVPGSLRKTLANIERLIDANVPVQISCPVMKTNYRSYKNVLSWAQDRSMKAYTDFIMMARSDGTTDNLDQRLTRAQARTLLEEIVHVDDDYRVMVAEEPREKLFMDQADRPVCGVAVNTLCMGVDGQCYPCSGWQGYKVGDLTTSTLAEVWNKSPQLNYLRSIKRGDFAQCQGCADQNYCAMCMVRNYNETGDIFSTPKHFCEMAELNREVVEEHRRAHKVASVR